MESSPIPTILSQLLSQTPALIVYTVGLVIGLGHSSKYPVPATMTVIASSLLLLTTIGVTMINGWLIARQTYGAIGVLGMGAGVIRAGAIGLLFMAVFAARTPAPPKV